MKIVVVGQPDDVRGAVLAGATYCRSLQEALADPGVGLIFSHEPCADERVVLLPEGEGGEADAAAGQHPGRVRRHS